MKKLTIYLFGFLLVSGLFGAGMVWNKNEKSISKFPIDTDTLPPFLNAKADKWVDSVFNSLTPDERIGQLFMVAAYSKTTTPNEEIISLIKNQKIGGLIFMQGGPGRQAILNNYYQNISKVPLMIGIDGEWGLSMRLDSTMKYPWQMTLGAIRDNQLIYDMGVEIGKECKRMGIHVNFAPVVDVNVNIKNPVIGARSFGDNKYNVADKGIAYALGMQSVGVLANAKHFPGHGDTDKDSHKSLPTIPHDKDRLDSIELYPFKRLIAAGIGSMMVAHLYIPAYDATANTATTLSPAVVTDLLQKQLGFKGLIFTDALGMKGVSSYNEPGMVDMKALKAGNDVLLFSGNVPEAIKQINIAIANNEISREMVDEKCKKILRAKYWMGLNQNKKVSLKNLYDDLHTTKADLVNRKLVENSITLLNNKDSLIPLRRLDTLKIATLAIGDETKNMFQKRVDSYTAADHFNIVEDLDQSLIDKLMLKLQGYNTILVSIHKSNGSPFKSYTITAQAKSIVEQLNNSGKTMVVSVFTNPYSLLDFKEGFKCKGLIMAYQNSDLAMDYTAQLIFGGIGAKGMLPVSLHFDYPYGFGLSTTPTRLKYAPAEDVGMDSKQFYRIDDIVKAAIKDSVFPGCQILAARKGVVFYNKGFGHYTYDKKKEVDENSIYDVASITKTSTSLPSIMRMVDEGKIDLNKTFGDYLPELQGSDKAGIVLIDQLTHQAGLKPWIPFYTNTLDADLNFKKEFYDTAYSEAFPLNVADHLYAKKDMENYMFNENKNTELNSSRKYKYSDLGFYFWMKIVEKFYGKRLDAFVEENFFSKLGATTTLFNPLNRFPKERVVPTENDKIFRKQMIQGYVHDQGAAMVGGVAGHAGLFSTANDLAKLYQMYLNNGTYGGERYLQESTVKEFTRCQFCANGNRRGIGWDKPDTNGEGGTACDCVSYLSFGHAGFTGCLVWVDPKEELVYIFFSNRIHPSAENTKLVKQGQRAQVQEVFYSAMM